MEYYSRPNTEAHSIAKMLRERNPLENTDVYVDLGEDIPEELDACLKRQVISSRTSGLSENGCAKLTELLQDYRSIFEYG